MNLQEIESEFGPKFQELESRAGDLRERLDAAQKKDDTDADAIKALTDGLTDVGEKVAALSRDRDEKLREVEYDSMKTRLESLEETLKAVRADDRFKVGQAERRDDGPYASGEYNFYADAQKALKGGDKDALERWTEAIGQKAITESTGTTGGYLVPDQISAELLELKTQQTVVRALCSNVQVTSDTLRIAGVTQGLVAGWVAELAEKPLSDLAFGEISTNVFQKAGLAVVSNQLLKDSTQSLQSLISRDLAKRLAALEELAIIDGSGTGQPLGILRTPGVGVYDPANDGSGLASTDVGDLLDAIITAITNIYTKYFGAPNAILLHPRTWARIVSAHADSSDQVYLVGPPSGVAHRTAVDPLPGYGQGQLPVGNLFGLPVYTSAYVPTNKGNANNESRVIVGRFDEGLILDREGITLDASEHVYFTSNQTVFRAEDRVGFTAARYPDAFQVIGGEGLANG